MLTRAIATGALATLTNAHVERPKITQLRMDPSSRTIVDQHNRQVILHGVNVVPKVAPYIPITDKFDPQLSLNQKDMEDLAAWGMNFIRLGVMWEAVERTPGVYDMPYLDKIEQLINKLGESGFFVLVDAHQDVGVRKLCGEGFPNWYAQKNLNHECNDTISSMTWPLGLCYTAEDYGWRYDADGNPVLEDCQKHPFFMYYTMPESVSLFDKLYENKEGMQDAFVNYWAVVSKRFAHNPYVIGYDPLNEPFPSTYFGTPSLYFQTGGFDDAKLKPMYSKIFDKYMEADPSKIMFFEGVQVPDTVAINDGMVFPTGFQSRPNAMKTNQVFNEHTYCCQMGPEVCDSGEPHIELKEKCRSFHDRRLKQRGDDARRLETPLIISEFGACFDSESCAMEIGLVADASDKEQAGWAYWQFKNYWDFTTTAGTGSEGFYNFDGTLQHKKVKALARTYLPFTQGLLDSVAFDTTTGNFAGSFTLDASIDAPSVLFFSEEFWYTNGYEYTVTDAAGHALNESDFIQN